ncbi:MAG: hypothetical protein COB08_018420 [Rhodobacteraceae bacterium]|nr:hypothetical protein [Paracoccaceae bacterium]
MKGYPSVLDAELVLDRSYRDLVNTLKNETITNSVRQAMSGAAGSIDPNAIDNIFEQLDAGSDLAETELSLADNFGLSKNAARRIISSFDSREFEEPSIETVAARIVALHKKMKADVTTARKLPKKEKKKRKRDIKKGIFATTFGLGVGVTNVILPSAYVFSYGLAGIATLQGSLFLIGELPKEE